MDRYDGSKTLFIGTEQVNYYNGINYLFPHSAVRASDQPYAVPKGLWVQMPAEFALGRARKRTEKFRQETETAAPMVIHAGQLRYQDCRLSGGTTDAQATSGEMETLEYFRAIAQAI